MMSILIKRAKYSGQDTQVFRAYTMPDSDTGLNYFGRAKIEPLGISASTTSNTIFGVQLCAQKGFSKIHNRTIDEKDISIEPLGNYQWQANWPF
jgi:hypothetical protein